MSGDAGRDRVIGGGGNDILDGDANRDRLRGGPGDDRCNPTGNDLISHCEFDLGGQTVTVRDGQARLAGGALAGSTLQYNLGLKLVHEVTELPLKDLVATTSWNQAHSMNLADIGKLEPGFLADVALLDKDFNVVRTIVGGVAR